MRSPSASCPQGHLSSSQALSPPQPRPHPAGPCTPSSQSSPNTGLEGPRRQDLVPPPTLTTLQTAESRQVCSPLPAPPRLHLTRPGTQTPAELRQPFVPGRLLWSPLLAA